MHQRLTMLEHICSYYASKTRILFLPILWGNHYCSIGMYIETGFYPWRLSAMSSSRKPPHSKSRLETMWNILYLYCSLYFQFLAHYQTHWQWFDTVYSTYDVDLTLLIIERNSIFFKVYFLCSYTKRMNNKSVSIFKFPYSITKIFLIWQKAPERGPVKIDSNLRKFSLLKLSVWVCLPGKIMLCNDFCTTAVFNDWNKFSLFLLYFPAVLFWSSCCCGDVTIVGKRFRNVSADSGFSSFLMLKSTAKFNFKRHQFLSPTFLLMKTIIEKLWKFKIRGKLCFV